MAIPKMVMSNVMNQSAPRTSWVIVSSRTGLDSAVSSPVYALSREVSRAIPCAPVEGSPDPPQGSLRGASGGT